MSKLILHQNSVIVKDNIVVGKLPKTKENDIILYNKKQTEKKLKDYANSDKKALAEIDAIIGKWAYALGIKIEARDILLLNDHIREAFPSLNIFDLKVCVHLVATDSNLLVTDAQHYGTLSFIYVTKVLKAYQEYRNEVTFGVRQKISLLEEENKTKITPNERLSNFKILLKQAKETNNSGLIYFDTGDVIYNLIKHNKLIRVPKELREEALDYGNKCFAEKAKKESFKSVINDVSFTKLKKDEIVLRYAREFIVNKWLSITNIDDFLLKLTYQMLEY